MEMYRDLSNEVFHAVNFPFDKVIHESHEFFLCPKPANIKLGVIKTVLKLCYQQLENETCLCYGVHCIMSKLLFYCITTVEMLGTYTKTLTNIGFMHPLLQNVALSIIPSITQ